MLINTIIPVALAIAAAIGAANWPGFISIAPLFAAIPAVAFLVFVFTSSVKVKQTTGIALNFFVVFWLIIGGYYITPSGIHASIPRMDVENRPISELIGGFSREIPEVTIECDPSVCDRTVTIHTIAPVTLSQMLFLIDAKAGTFHKIEIDRRAGKTIARDYKIRVIITPGPEKTNRTDHHDIENHCGSPAQAEAL